MKKLIFIITLCFAIVYAQAQQDSIQLAPYKRFPTYPPVKLLSIDSTSYFSKTDLPEKKPVLLMIFNPSCEHCQHETEELIKHMDELKKVTIVMATFMPFDSMMSFRKKYQLDQYPNIIMGQDVQYFLPTFYMISNLPFLAFYDKRKDLISVFEGSMPIEKVIAAFDK
jgi:thiol-disulfide isomerase/thioredoxin